MEFGFTKIRQILGHFHNDEALPLRCNCSVPCFRKEITIRNETGRRYQKNTARFHVSIFFYRIIGLDNFANTSDCVSMSSKEPKEFWRRGPEPMDFEQIVDNIRFLKYKFLHRIGKMRKFLHSFQF